MCCSLQAVVIDMPSLSSLPAKPSLRLALPPTSSDSPALREREDSRGTRAAPISSSFVISSTPFRPPSQLMFSHLRQWHSSGRIPVSKSRRETSCNRGRAAARYSSLFVWGDDSFASVLPARNLTLGELLSTPHSTARRRTRRKARRQLLTELPASRRVAARMRTRRQLGPDLVEFQVAPGSLDFLSESIPNLYQSHVLGDACSKVDFTQGSTRSTQKLLRVGIIFLSRMPTSPFASDVRCADFHLSRRVLIRLPGGLPNRLTVKA